MKAEHAKLPGAGIWPKQCPGKCAAEKGLLAKLRRNLDEGEIPGDDRAANTGAASREGLTTPSPI